MECGCDDYYAKRLRLAEVAASETRLELRGNENLAGPEIEKYLELFRDAFNKNANFAKYSDLNVGFH